MDLYAAMVTTAPFLLLALLAELKVFGPVGGATSAHQRREHRKTDQWIVVFLGVGFGAALFGLTTGVDTGYLRFLTTVPLALGAFILGAAVLASIRAAHDGPDATST